VAVPIDVAAGFFLTPRLAVGAGFNRSSYSDDVHLFIRVPDPIMLNSPGIAHAFTGALQHTESAVHVFGTLVLLKKSRIEWRLAGGPSFFHYTADMVQDVSYTQDVIPNPPGSFVTITGSTDSTVHGNGIGGHASSDFAYFLSRQVAITGVVRFSAAIVTLDREPLSLLEQEVRVGSTSVLVGLRFHFGSR